MVGAVGIKQLMLLPSAIRAASNWTAVTVITRSIRAPAMLQLGMVIFHVAASWLRHRFIGPFDSSLVCSLIIHLLLQSEEALTIPLFSIFPRCTRLCISVTKVAFIKSQIFKTGEDDVSNILSIIIDTCLILILHLFKRHVN